MCVVFLGFLVILREFVVLVLLPPQALGLNANAASGGYVQLGGLRAKGEASRPARQDVCMKFDSLGLYDQAEADFSRYKHGLTFDQQAEYTQFCAKRAMQACLTIIIINGRLFVKHFFPGYQSRHRSTLHAIYRVSQRFGPLPNAEFVLDVSDGLANPMELPIFIITRTRDVRSGVLYPDFTFYSWPEAVCPPERSHSYGYLYDGYAREAKKQAKDPKAAFGEKLDNLFWRGGVVGNPQRANAVNALQGVPGTDVAFMVWHNTSITGVNGAPGCVGLLDHCRYRYLALLNGNSYTSRLKYQLLCGSCVFASVPAWVEWWTHLFVPGEDYVDVREDWSNGPRRLAEIRASADGGWAIAERSRQKALALLSDDAVDCYWRRLIEKTAAVLPPPQPLDIEQLPPTTKPIEDALLFTNDVVIMDEGIIGPVDPVR